MALITDPVVIGFSNNRARTIADSMTELLSKLLAWQADYAAMGIAAKINADAAGAGSNLQDGSPADQRLPVSGTTLINFKAAIDQLVTAWNVTAVAGVGTTVAAVENTIQVNGSPR